MTPTQAPDDGALFDQLAVVRAAVGRGGVQKFRPRAGANPALLVGKMVYSAWR